jgi:hypothetical protein
MCLRSRCKPVTLDQPRSLGVGSQAATAQVGSGAFAAAVEATHPLLEEAIAELRATTGVHPLRLAYSLALLDTAHPEAVEAEAAGEVDVEAAGEAAVAARRQKLEGRRAALAWELQQVQAELGSGGGTPQLDAEAVVAGVSGQVHSGRREGWISL